MLKTLWNKISNRRKRQYYFLTILMLLASLLEVVSIGSIIPFLGALTAPEKIFEYELIQPLLSILGASSPNELILPFTVIFASAALLAGLVRLLLLYSMIKLAKLTGSDLTIDIFRRVLYQDYSTLISRNSSELINVIISKADAVIGSVIKPILLMVSSFIILVGIMGALFVINITIALSALVCFATLYLVIYLSTKYKIKQNSKIIAEESTIRIKSLQEGVGGIRDVIINGTQEFYCKIFKNSDMSMRTAAAHNQFISSSPKFIIEAIGISIIAALAYMLIQNTGSIGAIPVLGALALGAQRVFPLLQQIYASYTTMKGVGSSLEDVIEFLEMPLPSTINHELGEPIKFEKFIELKNVSFKYSKDSPLILKNLSLVINKGESIGFVGITGSGKSTLLDIIMMLFKPSSGNLIVDNKVINIDNSRQWQAHISHVPQSIFLFDSSIEENIAFGVPKESIDCNRVRSVAKIAQISDMVDSLKDGYQTVVGERGVRLSGGQRQRIGIARALYKKADVLILDEATSALDSKTERMVIKAIEDMDIDMTLLIIAHRLPTLKNCNKIIKLSENNNINIVNYEEIENEE